MAQPCCDAVSSMSQFKRRRSDIEALAKSKRNTRKRKTRSEDENEDETDEDQMQNDDDAESILTSDEIEYNDQRDFFSDGNSDFELFDSELSDGFSSDGSGGAYGDDNWKKPTPKRKGKVPAKIPKLSPGFDEDAESALMETAIELSKHTYNEELKGRSDAGPSGTKYPDVKSPVKVVQKTLWPEDDLERLRYYTRTGKERWRRKLTHVSVLFLLLDRLSNDCYYVCRLRERHIT